MLIFSGIAVDYDVASGMALTQERTSEVLNVGNGIWSKAS